MSVAAPESSELGPVRAAQRIASLDVLRGVAVLGILLMNIGGFANVWIDNPLAGDRSTADTWTRIITSIGFEGTMRGLFSLLFGAGVILLTSRAEAAGRGARIADVYYRRTIWLLIFGVFHGYVMLWPGDILYAYGMVGLFLFPLRVLRPRTLIIAGCVVLALLAAADMIELAKARSNVTLQQRVDEGVTLTEKEQERLDEWSEWVEEHSAGDQTRIELRRSGYLENFTQTIPMIVHRHTKETYLWSFWDALGVMLIGMAFMKLDVLTAALPRGTYVLMALLGYGLGFTVNIIETAHIFRNEGSLISFIEMWSLYNVARVPITIGHVGLVMLACQSGLLGWLQRPLAAVGRMALSNYLMQTVLCVLIFYGVGFGLFGRLGEFQLLFVVLAIWLAQLVISPVWLRYFRFGPAEWLWRSLTYVKLQPMRVTPRPPDASPR